MAEMCFVFGGEVRHEIECVAVCEEGIVTGGVEGEICLWMTSECGISTVCAIPEESRCLCLLILASPPDLQAFFVTGPMILSLHSNSCIRLWSFTDGKCLKSSNNLFSKDSYLEGMAKISNFEVAAYGKNKIFIIDPYQMQNLKYFSTNSKVFSLSTYGSEVWAQTLDSLCLFNTQCELENSPKLLIKNKIDTNFPVFLSGNSTFLAVGNKIDLQIFKKNKGITMKELTQEKIIEWIGWEKNGLVVVCEGVVRIFKIKDVLRGFLEVKFEIQVKILDLGLDTKGKFAVRGEEIYFCEKNCVKLFDFEGKNMKKWRIEERKMDFSMINDGESITARNILLGEEIFLGIGTNLGRVFVFSLHSESKQMFFDVKSEITCVYLHKKTLIVSNSDQSLSFWDFSLVSETTYHTSPVRTVEIWTSSIKLMIPLEYSSQSNCKSRWEEVLLGQTECGIVLLIDLMEKSIISYFQTLQTCVVSAVLHLNIDYLTLGCTNGHFYLFNMVSFTLEREIIYYNVLNSNLIEESAIVDRFSIILNGHIKCSIKKSIKIGFFYVSKSLFSVIFINTQKMIKKNHDFVKTIHKIWECSYLNGAFYSKNKEISFNYHTNGSMFHNSIKVVTLYQLCQEIIIIPTDLINLLLLVLSLECNFPKILTNFCSNTPNLKSSLQKSAIFIQNPPQLKPNLPKKSEQSSKIFLSEAILILINLINCILHPPQPNTNFAHDFLTLLKCNNHKFSIIVCQILENSSNSLRHCISESQMPELIQSLLNISLTHKNSDNEKFYQALVNIGLVSVKCFISILINEIKLSNNEKLHHKILFTIEYFMLKHSLHAISAIEEFADFLLKTRELKSSLRSKRFSADFLTVLGTFVELLPMTAKTVDARFLICGLPTGHIIIYDFKTNSKWKPFKLFNTAILAIGIKDSLIAVYSAQENLLKVTNMSSGKLKLTAQFSLPEIEPATNSYQEIIKAIKICFISQQTLTLTREDKKESSFSVNNS